MNKLEEFILYSFFSCVTVFLIIFIWELIAMVFGFTSLPYEFVSNAGLILLALMMALFILWGIVISRE